MTSPLDLTPPDDSGTMAFSRYVYQARVVVPFVVLMGLGEKFNLVVCEHYEDVAVRRHDDEWLFIQIKSRDPELGPWTIAKVCETGSGAFHSLLRTHRAIRDHGFQYRLVAFLEGPISRRDPLNTLAEGGVLSGEERADVAKRLGASDDECREFLDLLDVKGQRLRDSIVATNERLLGDYHDRLSVAEIRQIHRELERVILTAMSAELVARDWYSLKQPETSDAVQPKVITANTVAHLIAQLQRPLRSLLARFADPSVPLPSQLVEKLEAGGAHQSLIDTAIRRRADAKVHIRERGAATAWHDDEVDDVNERVLTLMQSIRVRHAATKHPANPMWAEALQRLETAAATYDPNQVFHADPLLLLGHACDLSDGCLFDWGQSDA